MNSPLERIFKVKVIDFYVIMLYVMWRFIASWTSDEKIKIDLGIVQSSIYIERKYSQLSVD